MDSIKKNTVAATMEMEMIQKEMATASLGFRKPWALAAAALSREAMLWELAASNPEPNLMAILEHRCVLNELQEW